MRLLLISNSTNAGEEYLSFPRENINTFLGNAKKIVFIPYAAVTFSYDEYEHKVNTSLSKIGYKVQGIHRYSNPKKAIKKADAIITGGGNTFRLVQMLHHYKLINTLRKKIGKGTPYIGWSAGSNIACPTLKTTNDMPIVEPESFETLNIIPFQINPHYLDANPNGHAGETREQRIEEFKAVNPDTYVAGLREGTMLKIEDNCIELIGNRSCRIFKQGVSSFEVSPGEDCNFLLK